MSGYYRVTYDTEIWREIGSILLADHQRIHPYNRAQIICDVTHLSQHGYLDQETADFVLQYYDSHETDFTPVRAHGDCVQNKQLQDMEERGGRTNKRTNRM